MPVLSVVMLVIVMGLLLWLINTVVPLSSSVKTFLNVVVVAAVAAWLMQMFGLWSVVSRFRLGR